jgi:hypothetical protein
VPTRIPCESLNAICSFLVMGPSSAFPKFESYARMEPSISWSRGPKSHQQFREPMYYQAASHSL